jgi:RNA polymerase sigma-70 factor, ECF subfamily
MAAIPTISDEQDGRDMARLGAGEDAALNALMDRHGQKLFHYLVRSLQDEFEAADLAQETFVKVYQNRAKFDSRQKFSTWLFAIASNLVRDRYRWRSRHPQVSLDSENEETERRLRDLLPAGGPLPDERIQTEERAEVVRKAIASLPEELRQPLLLAVYENLPQAEIALILSCSVKAVETRIYRARQQLRSKLSTIMPAV